MSKPSKTRRTPEQMLAAELAAKIRALPYEDLVYLAEDMQRRWPATAERLANALRAPAPYVPGQIPSHDEPPGSLFDPTA